MLKRKTLFDEWGSFVHREFHGTESLIGCHHFSLWYWKLWGTVTKTTLYIFSEIWQAVLTVPPFQSESRLGILEWLAKTWKGCYKPTISIRKLLREDPSEQYFSSLLTSYFSLGPHTLHLQFLWHILISVFVLLAHYILAE